MELVPIGEKCQPEMHLFVFTNMAAMSRANQPAIGHFSVVHSVPWPLSRSEAGGDLVLLLVNPPTFSCSNRGILMLTSP